MNNVVATGIQTAIALGLMGVSINLIIAAIIISAAIRKAARGNREPE